jgi:hypothetical protein
MISLSRIFHSLSLRALGAHPGIDLSIFHDAEGTYCSWPEHRCRYQFPNSVAPAVFLAVTASVTLSFSDSPAQILQDVLATSSGSSPSVEHPSRRPVFASLQVTAPSWSPVIRQSLAVGASGVLHSVDVAASASIHNRI